MAASNFDASLKRVLAHEGGWANHPKDPGGATMKGVIQRVYDGYRERTGLPQQSVRLISDAELKAIYRRQYWDAIRADELPAGVDFCAFDAAVNSGPTQGAKWLQRALDVLADGDIGESTLSAAGEADPVRVIRRQTSNRLAMLKSLNTWATFGKGWARRCAEVESAAIAMAQRAPKVVTPRPVVAQASAVSLFEAPSDDLPAGAAKADIRDVAISRTTEGVGGGATGVGAIGSVVTEQAQSMSMFADYSDVLRWLFAGLMALGVGLTLYGVWRRTREG